MSGPEFEFEFDNLAGGISDEVPWMTDGDRDIDNQGCYDSTPAVLEVHRQADEFKKLSVLSGNSVEGLLDEFVRERYGARGVMRLKLARFLLKSLGYRQSDDVLLMLACTKSAKVVIATAGAGKTTSLQFDIAITKMLDRALNECKTTPMKIEGTDVELSRILYLNYNRHNKAPIIRKHSEICAKVNSIVSESIRDDIDSDTVHALCRKWLQAASVDEHCDFHIETTDVMSDSEKAEIWNAVIVPRWKKFYGDDSRDMVKYEVLDELYNYKVESLLDWESFYQTSKFIDMGLSREFVSSCIKKYDSMKKQMQVMDFTDYLQKFLELLKSNEYIRNRLQKRYSLIIADENQDFTALMNELLLQLYNPEKNQLIVVGDPDQVIYAFKGVSPVNIVHLIEQLDDVETLGLDTNYRCPNVIIDAAKKILNLNILRFDKPLFGLRNGGKIIRKPYDIDIQQIESVLESLRRIGIDNYKNTVLSYRNNRTAIVMAEELFYAGVPFRVIDSNRPFNNPIFRHVFAALEALSKSDDFEANRQLSRFLPVSKGEWDEILLDNRRHRRLHLEDLQMPANSHRGLIEAFMMLIVIGRQIHTHKCPDYIQSLLKLYTKYYFNFIVRASDGEDNLNELYFERMSIFFKRPYTFDYMKAELLERNFDNPQGVTLSTFHGLKGLEFEYVLAVDFNESVFPRWEHIDATYPANTAIEEKEAENRLAYVLVTRTIKELHLFYNQADPSVYINILCGSSSAETSAKVSEMSVMDDSVIELGSISATGKSFASKLDFIQRMTKGRK